MLFFEVVIIVLLILFANSSVDVAGFMLNLFWFLLCVMYVCLDVFSVVFYVVEGE